MATIIGGAAALGGIGLQIGGLFADEGISIEQEPLRPKWERELARDAGNIFDEERDVLENALSQVDLANEEMYALLGKKPIYAEGAADRGALGKRANETRAAFDAAVARQEDVKQELKNLNAQLKKTPGQADLTARRRELRKEKRGAKRNLSFIREEAERADNEFARAQASPRQIVGWEDVDPKDPTGTEGSFKRALQLGSEALERAFRGEEPIDPTLRRQWDEAEQDLHERLLRSWGPDYASSSVGIESLAEFEKRKGEAFATYNRDVIGQYSALTESRAQAISGLTSERLKQFATPATTGIEAAPATGQVGKDRISLLEAQRAERDYRYGATLAREALKAGAAPPSLGQKLTSLGQGLSGAASSIGSFGSSAVSGAKSLYGSAFGPDRGFASEGSIAAAQADARSRGLLGGARLS